MIFSTMPDIIMIEEAKQYMHHLAYPDYFLPFIGVAKRIGSIDILIPVFVKIKGWTYAGLNFDLRGAVYSVTIRDVILPGRSVMPVLFTLATVSYI